jgi:hypothetical protein
MLTSVGVPAAVLLGAEAGELGPGGVAAVAAATGVAADTVRRGQQEVDDGTAPGTGRARPGVRVVVVSETRWTTRIWLPRSSR